MEQLNTSLCTAAEWSFLPRPCGQNAHADSRKDALREIVKKYPESRMAHWQPATQAKGDGKFYQDVMGEHWIPKTDDEGSLQMRVVLMDGTTVMRESPFTWAGFRISPKDARDPSASASVAG